jgi:hypothetical protein
MMCISCNTKFDNDFIRVIKYEIKMTDTKRPRLIKVILTYHARYKGLKMWAYNTDGKYLYPESG